MLAALAHHPEGVMIAVDIHVVDAGADASLIRNPFVASSEIRA